MIYQYPNHFLATEKTIKQAKDREMTAGIDKTKLNLLKNPKFITLKQLNSHNTYLFHSFSKQPNKPHT